MGAAHPRIGPPRTIAEAESLLNQLALPYPGRDRFIALGQVEGDSLKNAICCLANGDARAPQARAYLTALLSASSDECLAILAKLGYPDIPMQTLSRCIKEGDIKLPNLIQEAGNGNPEATLRVREILSFVGNLEPQGVFAQEDPLIEPPFIETLTEPSAAQDKTPQSSVRAAPDPIIQPAKTRESLPTLVRCEDDHGQRALSLIGQVMTACSLPSALAVCMGWQREALCGQLILRYQSHGVKVISSTSDIGFYEGENLFEFSDAILRTIMENRPHLTAESVLIMAKALFAGSNGAH